jgi:hypothetical protein
MKTGEAEFPVHERVAVIPLKIEGDDVLADVAGRLEESSSEHREKEAEL